MSEETVISLASKIRLMLMDVDGVLTDGRIHLVPMPDGGVEEMKVFDVMDGAGIALAHRAGLKTGIITRRISAAVAHRARELSIQHCYQAVADKRAALDEILSRSGCARNETCFVGDDLVDLPLFSRVGLPVAVANAHPEVRSRAALILQRSGGHGAIRELVEFILTAQGKWEDLVRGFEN